MIIYKKKWTDKIQNEIESFTSNINKLPVKFSSHAIIRLNERRNEKTKQLLENIKFKDKHAFRCEYTDRIHSVTYALPRKRDCMKVAVSSDKTIITVV